MKILILQHEADSPPGQFADWVDARGHSAELVDVPTLDSWPAATGVHAVVSLGSDCSVHASPDPWIAREVRYLAQAHRAGVPLLGICFGGQALAAALGGRVLRAAFIEAAWTEVDTVEDDDLLTPGPWLRWHEDVFTLPKGARLLAWSAAGPLGFQLGSSVGLQIHPEIDLGLAQFWIQKAGGRLEGQPVGAAELARQCELAAPGARERAFALFDRIERLWADSAAVSIADRM